MRVRSTFAGSLFLLVLLNAGALAAQAPLVVGLGGAADLGEGSLAPNDDGSSTFIDLTAAFPVGLRFYGNVYPGVYVNNNGNISFGAALGSFTPTARLPGVRTAAKKPAPSDLMTFWPVTGSPFASGTRATEPSAIS